MIITDPSLRPMPATAYGLYIRIHTEITDRQEARSTARDVRSQEPVAFGADTAKVGPGPPVFVCRVHATFDETFLRYDFAHWYDVQYCPLSTCECILRGFTMVDGFTCCFRRLDTYVIRIPKSITETSQSLHRLVQMCLPVHANRINGTYCTNTSCWYTGIPTFSSQTRCE